MLKKNTAPKKEGHIKHKRLYAGTGLHIKRKRDAYASLPFLYGFGSDFRVGDVFLHLSGTFAFFDYAYAEGAYNH